VFFTRIHTPIRRAAPPRNEPSNSEREVRSTLRWQTVCRPRYRRLISRCLSPPQVLPPRLPVPSSLGARRRDLVATAVIGTRWQSIVAGRRGACVRATISATAAGNAAGVFGDVTLRRRQCYWRQNNSRCGQRRERRAAGRREGDIRRKRLASVELAVCRPTQHVADDSCFDRHAGAHGGAEPRAKWVLQPR